jgi:hypothetical protein
VEIDDGIYSGTFVVIGTRKSTFRKTFFHLSAGPYDEFWIKLKRSPKKGGIAFRPLRQVAIVERERAQNTNNNNDDASMDHEFTHSHNNPNNISEADWIDIMDSNKSSHVSIGNENERIEDAGDDDHGADHSNKGNNNQARSALILANENSIVME